MLKCLYKMQIAQSEELTYVLQVHAQETTFGDKKYDYCRWNFVAQSHLEHKNQMIPMSKRNRDEDTPAVVAPSTGKVKGKGKCQKQVREGRLHTLDHERPMLIRRLAFRHDPNKKGKEKGRPRSPSRVDHFTRKMLVNTWDLRHTWLWCIGWGHESVLCVDVKCAKICCFITQFHGGCHFFSKRSTK